MTTTIWIEDGCIACSACIDVAPEIFAMDAGDGCLVVAAARVDGRDSTNRSERSPLRPEVAAYNRIAIEDAINGCPVACLRMEQR